MNAPIKTPEATELQRIDEALTALLDAIIEHDSRPKPREDRDTYELHSIADLAAAAIENAKRSEAGRFVHRLQTDGGPVRYALVHAVRMIGKRLHEIGGLSAMHDAMNHQEDQPRGGWRVAVIDKRWDGIGGVWWS